MSECGSAIQVGCPAPSFEAKGAVGQKIVDIKFEGGKLTVDGATSEGKYTVVYFYPLDFTFVCPTEIIAFSEKIDEFEKIGANVVGVSVDSEFTHLAWLRTPRKEGGLGDIKYPLVADLSKSISRNYNVLLPDGVAARGLFVIDPEGVVQSMTVNNLGVGRNIDEVLRLIQAFQYVAEHGEVCPANWTPGDDTMQPDPEGSKSYFEKVG